MSDAIALVRFLDGDVKCAYYFGSVDAVLPLLFPLEQADALLEGGMEPLLDQLYSVEQSLQAAEAVPDDLEPVQIWSSYGDRAWWEGTASRRVGYIWDGVDPYGIRAEMGDPDGPPSREVHSDDPDWLPPEWR